MSIFNELQHQNIFQQITSPLIEGVVIIDNKGIILAINDAVLNLFGYAEKELLGKNVSMLMPEEHSSKHDSYIDAYQKTGEHKILDLGRKLEGLHKDKSIFSLNLKVNKITLDGVDYFIGVIESLEKENEANFQIANQNSLLERAEKVAKLGHWSLDLSTDKVFWSKEIYSIHGVTPEDYKPELSTAINFYHEDDLELVEKSLILAIENKKDFTFEARIVQPSGDVRFIRSSGECMTNREGEVSSLFGVFQDITEQVLTSETVKEALAFQKLIFDSIPDYLFIKDRDFKIVEANDAFFNLYPESMHDKIIGHTTIEEYDEKEANEFLKEDRKAFSEGVSEIEETLDFPDGRRRSLLTKKVKFSKGDGADYILGLARDITELKKSQKQLIDKQYEAEAYADATNDGYWDWLIQDDYEYMSPRFWEMLGYDPSEKRHHPEEWQSLIFEEDLQIALGNFEKHISTKGQHPFSQEVRYKHKDGSTVYVICKGRVVEWDDHDQPVRMIGTHTDISELKRVEEELNAANEELEEFAYRTSHDLRSPLLSSIGLISMAQNALDEGDESLAQESLKHSEDSLKRLEALIKDILLLTQTKNVEEESRSIDFSAKVTEAIEKLDHMDGFSRLEIETNFGFKKPIVSKVSRIQLIIDNLISNAVKYQDENEQTPYIKMYTYEEGENFVFEVRDNGIGIPEDKRNKLFKMFERLHGGASYGTGLGLYMVSKSANIIGGCVVFEQSDKGSTFKLVIPLERLSDDS